MLIDLFFMIIYYDAPMTVNDAHVFADIFFSIA